jgi:FkbM family methyltransferase
MKIDIIRLSFRINNKNRFRNAISLIRHRGELILPNGVKLKLNKYNFNDVEEIYRFALVYGVEFRNEEGYWRLENDKIITPKGIKFNIKSFHPLIFAETFLYDIHFSCFDLDNKIVVQAGGFTGDTALYYASRGAKVYSFEPDTNSYNLALENIRLNPDLSNNIVMKNYAIGKDEYIDFPINPLGSGGSSAFDLENKETVKIRSVSIGTILKEFDISDPFLLDLDIKGKEFDVIQDENISKFKMIRIEYTTVIGKQTLGSRQQIIDKLKKYGFNKIRIFKHNEGRFELNNHGTIEAIKQF